MEEQNAWAHDELQGSIHIFRNIQTDFGLLVAVYLGPGGAFIQLEHLNDPDRCCVLLKDLLQVSRLQLYSSDQGAYHCASSRFAALLPKENAETLALAFVSGRESGLRYSPEDLTRTGERLKRADAYARGWYRTSDGRLYRRHGNVFREISDIDSNLLFHLTLWGGACGLHRFYLGYFWTGLLYLFTGGFLLAGYICDLVFLLLGCLRNKHGRLLHPPANRLGKTLLLPAGFLLSCCYLALLMLLFHTAAHGQFARFSDENAIAQVIFQFLF